MLNGWVTVRIRKEKEEQIDKISQALGKSKSQVLDDLLDVALKQRNGNIAKLEERLQSITNDPKKLATIIFEVINSQGVI